MQDSAETSAAQVEVKLDGVSKEYRSGDVVTTALRDVSLEIPRGQLVVILGPSGSGKSTFLNIVGGIDTSTSGRVWVAGQEVSGLGEIALTLHRRTHVGFVFQFFNLVPTLTARENVDLVGEMAHHRNRVDPIMESLGLGKLKDHFPSQMSGGEQQRVAIARALVKDPPLLLCDEPTGALDFETGKIVLGAIKSAAEATGKTVIMVTHNAAIGRMADRVIRMRSGELADDTLVAAPVPAESLEW